MPGKKFSLFFYQIKKKHFQYRILPCFGSARFQLGSTRCLWRGSARLETKGHLARLGSASLIFARTHPYPLCICFLTASQVLQMESLKKAWLVSKFHQLVKFLSLKKIEPVTFPGSILTTKIYCPLFQTIFFFCCIVHNFMLVLFQCIVKKLLYCVQWSFLLPQLTCERDALGLASAPRRVREKRHKFAHARWNSEWEEQNYKQVIMYQP